MTQTAEQIKASLSRGHFRISVHAAERMNKRSVTRSDIKNCGKTARRAIFQEGKGTWKLEGDDLDGVELTVICAVDEQLIVVTIY